MTIAVILRLGIDATMKICPTCLGRFDEEAFCPDDGTELRQIHTDSGDKMLGRVLDGRWLIEEKIGEGGMGAVYRGEQTSVGRPIAVKTLLGSLADTDEYVERFFREANVASTLNDPHCVTIYDFGQDAEDHALYLAMEYLEGRELSEFLRDEELTLREALTIGVQICSALAAAHGKNIVHRDLKPENIFLVDVPGGKIFVKVLDFGIAKILDSESSSVTRTGFSNALEVREALEEQLEVLSNDKLALKPAAACEQPISTAKTLTSKPRTVAFDKLAADGGSRVVDLGEAGRAADADISHEEDGGGSNGGRVWLAVGAAMLVAAGGGWSATA